MPPHGRHERLAEVYRRLDAFPAAASAEEALGQLRECLNAVEDELSGIPSVDPPPADGGGRMYFPLPDRTVIHADGGITARTIGHTIWTNAVEVEYATAEWVAWYNHQRLHGALGHIPPAEYEAAYWARETSSEPAPATVLQNN